VNALAQRLAALAQELALAQALAQMVVLAAALETLKALKTLELLKMLQAQKTLASLHAHLRMPPEQHCHWPCCHRASKVLLHLGSGTASNCPHRVAVILPQSTCEATWNVPYVRLSTLSFVCE